MSTGTRQHVSTAIAYKSYYEQGIYAERYNNEVLEQDRKTIIDNITGIHRALARLGNSRDIAVFDYGCGDGRHFKIYEEAAELIKPRKLILSAIDVCAEALDQYSSRLSTKNYSEIPLTEEENILIKSAECHADRKGRLKRKMKKSNLEVRFIHNHEKDDLEYEMQLLGKQDFGMAIFGVISHIIEQSRCEELIRLLSKNTKIDVIYSIPNEKFILCDEKNAIQAIRKVGLPVNAFGYPVDGSTTLYARQSQDPESPAPIVLPYRLFSFKTVVDLFSRIGTEFEISAQKTETEVILTHSKETNEHDSRLCANLPKVTSSKISKDPQRAEIEGNVLDETAHYFYVKVKGQYRERHNHSPQIKSAL